MAVPRVLVAPDSFKGTFSAREVTDLLGRGLAAAGCAVDACPVADGGEGTLDALLAALGGERLPVVVPDPLGRPRTAEVGLLPGGRRAVVEAAQAVGLPLVPEHLRRPEASSTEGVGAMVLAARDAGAEEVVVSVGGVATTDGGAGALAAIAAGGGLRGARLVVLCDVTTPFERAAEVFGPQKGADAAAVARLTARLRSQAAGLPRDPRGVPRTGAAGGLSGGLWAALGAELVDGAGHVLDLLGVDARLARSAAAVTGEGQLDEQSFEGKVVGALAARALAAGAPLHVVAGRVALPAGAPLPAGIASAVAASSAPELVAAGRALGERLLARAAR